MFETSALIKYDQDTLLALWCANKGKRRSNFNIFQISNNPISNNYERCCKYAILKNLNSYPPSIPYSLYPHKYKYVWKRRKG
mmetsp:Transcript_25290/g.50990  ORF Transcript_25290/g.50990 Transcript_25290/m.50990 type:complete len:82 (-) Transcript_25290:253-498(-)